MAAPLIPQGTLNRLRGSVIIPSYPQLTVTAPFLGEEGINLTPQGEIVESYGTMTGTALSPAPYQMVTVEIELLKTQFFSDLYKKQIELNAIIGDFVVRTDASTLSNYHIYNGSIHSASPGRLNGKSVGFVVSLMGYYAINSNLFSNQ